MAATLLAGEFAEFLMVTLQIIKEAVSSFFCYFSKSKDIFISVEPKK